MSDLFVSAAITIPERELEEKFVRSSGPGGQNVNKVSSAVQLSFDVRASTALPEWARTLLLNCGDGRLTNDGVLIITAQKFRAQERNRQDARARLAELIAHATRPIKARRATRPPRASKRKRLESKKLRATVKQGRGRPGLD